MNKRLRDIGKPSTKGMVVRTFTAETNTSSTMTNPGGGGEFVPPVKDDPTFGSAAIAIVSEIVSKITSGGSGASACCAGTGDLSEIEEIVL